MDEKILAEFEKYRLNTLEQATKTAELFRLKNELSELMYRHVKDCTAILTKMEHLIEELKEAECFHVEQTRQLMEQDRRGT